MTKRDITIKMNNQDNNNKKNVFEQLYSGANSLISDKSIQARVQRTLNTVKVQSQNVLKDSFAHIGSVSVTTLDKVKSTFQSSASSKNNNNTNKRNGFDENDTGETIDLQVSNELYVDSPAFLRTQLWESSLRKTAAASTTNVSYELIQSRIKAKIEAKENQTGEELELELEENLSNVGENYEQLIERDLRRTFPNHPAFKAGDRGERGIRKLRRLLLAYAEIDRACGYCQGMAFICSILALYLNEEDAFEALCFIMQKRKARLIFHASTSAGFGLKRTLRCLDKLLLRENEKLALFLGKYQVDSTLFASSWILTSFSSDFNTRFACRILDVIIANGNLEFSYGDFVVSVAVSLLNEATEDLLGLVDSYSYSSTQQTMQQQNSDDEAFERIINYLRTMPQKWESGRQQRVLTLAINAIVERTKECREIYFEEDQEEYVL